MLQSADKLLMYKETTTFSSFLRIVGVDDSRLITPASRRIDGENGVLHLCPDRGGHAQDLKYKVIDKNQMEWTDRKGNVTIAHGNSADKPARCTNESRGSLE